MSQNQEIIEAKLCAFIDGELDAEGRVEIEKHLEANPQHRRLLESLKATRDLIKWLPREAAPPEVAETLNGQLERSVLLDSDSEFLRPSIWPRVMAAAAIILLTAGLGLAVYFTLPKSQKNATPFAANHTPDTPGIDAEPDRTEDAVSRREPAGGTMAKGGAADLRSFSKSGLGNPAQSEIAKAENAKSESAKSDEELERWATQVKQNRDAINAVANGAQNNAVQNQVAQTAGPVSSNAVVMLVRSNAPQATRQRVTDFLASNKIQWKETPAGDPEAQLAQQQQQFTYRNTAAQFGQQSQVRQNISQTAPSQLAENNAAPAVASKASAEASSEGATTQPAPAPTTVPFDRLASVPPGMYVARMSRQQAVSLGNTISQATDQSTQLKDLNGATLTFDQLSGRQVYGMLNAAVATEPSQGQEQDQSPDRRMRRAAGQLAAGLSGAGATTAPATQSADQQQPPAPLTPATQSANQQLQAPATQPAATQPTDETVDVVIVVESGATASRPSSQPAAESPATQPAVR